MDGKRRRAAPKGLRCFDRGFGGRRGRAVRRRAFALAFRTLSVPQMSRRLAAAGFAVEALLGDYDGGPWHRDADAWIIIARKV